ncbi:hypothetical protein ABVK25_011548 [Lepraria finkii]|uniref:Ketoreductase (KR) domain-containing protein n=1 Tax=Lepraria finkii TaxID=1340010 RepID=A0ABR4AM03_9LECA
MYPPPKDNVDKLPRWGQASPLRSTRYIRKRREAARRTQTFGDVGYFFAWIKRKGQNDHSDLMEEARQLASDGHVLQNTEELVSQAADVMEVKVAKLLRDNMADILYERRTGMDVIISEDLLTPLYHSGLLMTGIYPQLFHVLAGTAHSNPKLRIVEIGGGTGGAARKAMKAFNGPNGIKAYRNYTFTDISPGFLSLAHATFYSVDPFIILDSDPVLGEELMQAVDSYYCKGLIGPIQRVTPTDVAQLSPVLSNFSNIIGKLVVSFKNPESLVRMIPSAPTDNFDSESCYIIAGALGGLEQPLIRWMGDRGARHLALVFRRDIISVAGAQKLVKSLASRDIHVECFFCDVSKKDQVMRVIQQISSSRTSKGIVHAAVSHLDLTFDKLSSS